MRVFVTGTGRCGTSTFYNACKHITNYSSAHEGKRCESGVGDWEFPDNHIEVASNLVIGLPILFEKYPDAFWVHLWRLREPCVKSLSQSATEPMQWFANQFWYFKGKSERGAEAFYDFCNAQIRFYLSTLPENQKTTILLKEGIHLWEGFWNAIGAKGDFSASQRVWTRKYNPGHNRGLDKYEVIQ